MDVPQIPPSILEKPPGCMLIQPSSSGLAAFVRTTKWGASKLPRICSVDMQLPSWDSPPVMAVAFLLRLARDELLTHQTWIDAGNPNGMRVLQTLARQEHVYVHIVANEVERTLRTHNIVKQQAAKLVKELEPRQHAWSKDLFEQARQRIDTLYPTACRLWRTGREERQRQAR